MDSRDDFRLRAYAAEKRADDLQAHVDKLTDARMADVAVVSRITNLARAVVEAKAMSDEHELPMLEDLSNAIDALAAD